MLDNNLAKELNDYISDMLTNYCEECDIPKRQWEKIIYDKDFKDYIVEDLVENGLKDTEAQAVAYETGYNEDTVYKLLAYFYGRYDDYNSLETLKKVIEDSSFSKIDEFTEEELNKIFEASK